MPRSPASLAQRLATSAARGLGCANAVAEDVLAGRLEPKALVDALDDALNGAINDANNDAITGATTGARAIVCVRAANALKKVSRADSSLLAPFASRLLRSATACEYPEARWNLHQVLAALPLRGRDRNFAIDLIFEALSSPRTFVRADALTGLARFAATDDALYARIRPLLENATGDKSAAIRARARKEIVALTTARRSVH